MGLDGAVLFPNFGLLWERPLSESTCPRSPPTWRAWNRWCATVARRRRRPAAPGRPPHPARPRLAGRAARRARRGRRALAMIAPALVDGKPLSHPDHDRLWSAFVEHGVTPVFHVADQPRVFDDGWYTDAPEHVRAACSTRSFLWTAAALAVTDLIVNGVFDAPSRPAHRRHRAQRRVGADVPDDARRWLGLHHPAQRRPARAARRRGRASTSAARSASPRSPTSSPTASPGRPATSSWLCSDYPHSEGTARRSPTTRPAASTRNRRPRCTTTTSGSSSVRRRAWSRRRRCGARADGWRRRSSTATVA